MIWETPQDMSHGHLVPGTSVFLHLKSPSKSIRSFAVTIVQMKIVDKPLTERASALPAVGLGLGQADVGEDAVDELARHGIQACRAVVEGRD